MSLGQTRLAAGVQTPRIKEEPEEQSVKQEEEQLPVTDRDTIAIIVKSEEEEDDGAEESHQFSVCNRQFWTTEPLETHNKHHTREKPFTKANHLDSHKKTHQGAIIFHCSVCQVDFSDLSIFTQHLIRHKDRTSSWSGSSPTSAESEEKLCDVLNQENSETPQTKEEPEERSVRWEEEQLPGSVPESGASSLHKKNEHKMQRGTEGCTLDIYETCSTEIGAQGKRQKCPFCKKTYYSRQGLKRHMKVHTGNMPYSCSRCQKTFFQKYTYDAHMRMHTGELTCAACGKSFAYKETYQAHLRTHKGECYSCADCGKSFAYNKSYQAHLRTHAMEETCTDAHSHMTERPFSCSLCNRAFKKRVDLDSHMKAHRERDPAAVQS